MEGGGKGMKRRFGMSRPLQAHLSLFCACAFWGLMAPLGKDAMTHGVDGLTMVTFRVLGGCVLFWITLVDVPFLIGINEGLQTFIAQMVHLCSRGYGMVLSSLGKVCNAFVLFFAFLSRR